MELQQQKKLQALVKQCPTRWCSITRSCASVLASESILMALVSDREFVKAGTREATQKRIFVKKIVQGSLFGFVQRNSTFFRPEFCGKAGKNVGYPQAR